MSLSLVPPAAEPLVRCFSVAFTRRTFQRFVLLLVGSVLSPRCRTVAAVLRTLGPLAGGHWSSMHRVLCRRVWSNWTVGRVLAAMVLEFVPPGEPVVVAVDDTAVQRKGKHVFGQGKHLDPLRSTRRFRVWLWGHKWVVLAVNVKFGFASRPWSLPVLCALYQKRQDLKQARQKNNGRKRNGRKKNNRDKGRGRQGRRHKTHVRLAMQLLAALARWFPQRRFVLLADGGYCSHELARFAWRHRRRVTLVGKLHPKAALYEKPAPYPKGKSGRPRIRGRRLPSPKKRVEQTPPRKRRRAKVSWYGGKTRRVELLDGTGRWYKAGSGAAVPIRWVFVHDLDGTHRDEYFFSTDAALKPERVVGLYTGRWSIEVTFQEAKTHLGLTTLRNWSRKSVLRAAPCLLGLFSLVSLIFARQHESAAPRPTCTGWYNKREPTFSDAITCVRRLCWREVLLHPPFGGHLKIIPPPLQETLLEHLSRAA